MCDDEIGHGGSSGIGCGPIFLGAVGLVVLLGLVLPDPETRARRDGRTEGVITHHNWGGSQTKTNYVECKYCDKRFVYDEASNSGNLVIKSNFEDHERTCSYRRQWEK